MACRWSLYQKCCELIIGKNWIIDLKRNDRCCQIKIISNKVDISIRNQLKMLDNLYNDYDIESYSFDNFFVKEIIAVKNVIILFYFYFQQVVKMENINSKCILGYMNNIESFDKATKMTSVTIARCICHITL